MIGNILKVSESNVPGMLYHTHDNAFMGSLVRVFGVDPRSTVSVDELLSREPIFECFFPVKAALKGRLITVVDSRAPQGRWATFPVFKTEGVRPPRSVRGAWWLWDGNKEWFYEGKEEVIANFPERELLNDTALIWRIREFAKVANQK